MNTVLRLISTHPRSIAQRLKRGSIWSLLGTGFGRAFNLLAMVIVARLLGAEDYGGLGLVQSTIGLLGLFAGAALGATATRFIAATHGIDRNRTGRIIAMVIISATCMALLFSSLIVIFSNWTASRVLLAPELASATAVGGILLAVGVLRGVQDATLAGFEAFQQVALLRFVEGLSTVLLVPVFVGQFGLPGGIASLAAGQSIALLPGGFFVAQQLRKNGINLLWLSSFKEWRIMRDFSAPSLIAGIVATPVLWLSTLLLSQKPGGFIELGLYNAGYQWHGPLVFIPTVISAVSLPILSQIWTAGNQNEFRDLFVKVCKYGLFFSVLPVVVSVSLIPAITSLYGEEFKSGAVVFSLLMIAAPFHVISKIATSAIQSMDLSWYLLAFNGLWGVILLALALFTIDEHGAEGLALSFCVSYFVLAVSLCAFVFQRIKKSKR